MSKSEEIFSKNQFAKIEEFPTDRDFISGIYCIYGIEKGNKLFNSIYIGSSKNIYKRIYGNNGHLYHLRKKTHKNKYLQNYYNKYGEISLEFYIVENVPPEDEILKNREQYYFDKYKPFYSLKRGFNIAFFSERPSFAGHKQSDYQKNGTSERNKKNKVGNKYNKGKKLSDESKEKISKKNTGKKRTSVQMSKIKEFHNKRKKSFKLISPDNDVVEFSGIKEFARLHGLDSGTLSKLVNGKRRTYKGWKYFEE